MENFLRPDFLVAAVAQTKRQLTSRTWLIRWVVTDEAQKNHQDTCIFLTLINAKSPCAAALFLIMGD
jgi:hypothetical protein